MLKKLQNLLFEDEEYDDEEDEFEPEEVMEAPAPKPAAPKPAPAPAPKPVAAPAPAPAPAVQPVFPVFDEPEEPVQQKTMQRIDVTQPLPVIDNTTYAPRPQQPARESVFAEQPAAKPVQKPATLGIKADPTPKPAPAPQPVKTAPKPAAKPAPAKPVKAAKPAYNFQPVISPIFGVDEKDMNSLKTTTNRINAKEQTSKKEGKISPIISPMYGSNTEESIIAPKEAKKAAVSAAEDSVLDDVMPDFSIDDILAAGDEKFAEEKRVVEESLPLFPDLEFEDDAPAAKKSKK